MSGVTPPEIAVPPPIVAPPQSTLAMPFREIDYFGPITMKNIAKWLRLDRPHCIFGQLIFEKIIPMLPLAIRGQILAGAW